jgi:hypothetical protein
MHVEKSLKTRNSKQFYEIEYKTKTENENVLGIKRQAKFEANLHFNRIS